MRRFLTLVALTLACTGCTGTAAVNTTGAASREPATAEPQVEPPLEQAPTPRATTEPEVTAESEAKAEPEEVDPEPAQPAERAVPTKILEWSEFGGCDLIGLCSSFVVFSDGTVEAVIEGDATMTSSVDVGLVDAVVANADVDIDTLRKTLGQGPCISRVDGIDERFVIVPSGFELDTCEGDIYASGAPILVAATQLVEATLIALSLR